MRPGCCVKQLDMHRFPIKLNGSDLRCSRTGCQRKPLTEGLCHSHWVELRRRSDPWFNWPNRPPQTCKADGCSTPVRRKGYCDMHATRVAKYGVIRASASGAEALRCSRLASSPPPVSRTVASSHLSPLASVLRTTRSSASGGAMERHRASRCVRSAESGYMRFAEATACAAAVSKRRRLAPATSTTMATGTGTPAFEGWSCLV